jgi:CRP-like cAMP-binding protein
VTGRAAAWPTQGTVVTDHNRLLTLFCESDAGAISAQLQPIQLKHGEILHEAGELIERVYFAIDAMISLVIPLREGGAIETAVVGSDGVAGASSAIDGQRTGCCRAIVQIAGPALSLDIELLRRLARESHEVHGVLSAHEGVILAQSQQTARATPRMMTHDFVAEMLGVRRTTVTLAAQSLQQAGAIRYKRGHVRLLQPAFLKEMSCECYEAISDRFAQLFRFRENW